MAFDMASSAMLREGAYIDGKWHGADNGETYPVTNPANGDVIANVARCGRAETERAIIAAEQALVSWQAVPAKQKSNLLYRWFELVMEHQEELAQILTAEQGKPLAEARGEVHVGPRR